MAEKKLKIEFESNAAKEAKNIEALENEIAKLKAEYKKASLGSDAFEKSEKELALAQADHDRILKSLNKTVSKNTRENKINENSLEALNLEITNFKNKLNKATIGSAEFTRIQAQLKAAQNKYAMATGGATVATVKQEKATDRLRLKTAGLRRSIGAVRNELLLFTFATAGVMAAVNSLSKDSLEQEEIFKSLEAIINVTGASYNNLTADINNTFAELQAFTKYGDTDSAQVLQKLIALTGDYDVAMKGLPMTLDLAASGLFDTQTAARMVGMALTGNIEMLGRYIPEFKVANNEMLKNATASEKAAYATEVLTQKFGGLAAQEAISNPGKIQQLTNYWGDYREMIGDKVTPTIGKLSTTLIPLFNEATTLAEIHKREIVLNSGAYTDFGKEAKRALLLEMKYLTEVAIELEKNPTMWQNIGRSLTGAVSDIVSWEEKLIGVGRAANTLTWIIGGTAEAINKVLGLDADVIRTENLTEGEERLNKINEELLKLRSAPLYELMSPEQAMIIGMLPGILSESNIALAEMPSQVKELNSALSEMSNQLFNEISLGIKLDTESIKDQERDFSADLDHWIGNLKIEPLKLSIDTESDSIMKNIELLNTYQEAGLEVTNQLNGYWEWYFDSVKEQYGEDSLQFKYALTLKETQLEESTYKMGQITQQFAGFASNAIYEAFGGRFDNIEEEFKNLLKRMAADLILSGILKLINPLSTGFGIFGGIFSNGGEIVNQNGSPIVKGRTGLDFTVPQGYPNDSFPILVESGERVQVTPASQVRNPSNDSGLETAILIESLNRVENAIANQPRYNIRTIDSVTLSRQVEDGTLRRKAR